MKYFGYSKTPAHHNRHNQQHKRKRTTQNKIFMTKRHTTRFGDVSDYMKSNQHSLKNMKPSINTRIESLKQKTIPI